MSFPSLIAIQHTACTRRSPDTFQQGLFNWKLRQDAQVDSTYPRPPYRPPRRRRLTPEAAGREAAAPPRAGAGAAAGPAVGARQRGGHGGGGERRSLRSVEGRPAALVPHRAGRLRLQAAEGGQRTIGGAARRRSER